MDLIDQLSKEFEELFGFSPTKRKKGTVKFEIESVNGSVYEFATLAKAETFARKLVKNNSDKPVRVKNVKTGKVAYSVSPK